MSQGASRSRRQAQDALGSVRVVFDAAGQVTARADYEPFGEAFTWPGAPGGALPAERFTGQERDPEASQDYFGARYYQPRHGRFSQGDPVYAGLFDPQQWNRYAYARNNPLSFVDPDGRTIAGPWCVMLWGKWEVCVGGGGEIGGNGDGGGAGGFWSTDPHRPIFGGGLEGGVDEPQGGGGRVGGTGPGTPQTPPTEGTPNTPVNNPPPPGPQKPPDPKEIVNRAKADFHNRLYREKCGALYGGGTYAQAMLRITPFVVVAPDRRLRPGEAATYDPSRSQVLVYDSGSFFNPPRRTQLPFSGSVSFTPGQFQSLVVGHELLHRMSLAGADFNEEINRRHTDNVWMACF
jgi:RHS repeat-associated protein